MSSSSPIPEPKRSEKKSSSDPNLPEQTSMLEKYFNRLLLAWLITSLAGTAQCPIERYKIIITFDNHYGKPDTRFGWLKRSIAQDGRTTLWKGNVRLCLRRGNRHATSLVLNDFIFENISPRNYNDLWSSFTKRLVAGGTAGVITSAMLYPSEIVAMKLYSDRNSSNNNPRFKNGWDLRWNLFKTKGVAGFYLGWSPVSAFIFRAGRLGGFGQLQDIVNPYNKETGIRGWCSSFLSATIARSLTLPLSHPIEVMNMRRKFDLLRPAKERTYNSALHYFTKTMQQGGVRDLYWGTYREFFRGKMTSLIIVAYDRGKLQFNL